MINVEKKRLKVLLQHLQTIRKEADKKGAIKLYDLLEEAFVAHMCTKQYCALRTDEDKLEFYSGVNCKFEQFPNGATSQRKRELLNEYLEVLIEDINQQL